MYLIYNKNLIITAVSNTSIKTVTQKQKRLKGFYKGKELIGKRLPKELIEMSDFEKRDPSELKIAFVCNWNDQCGISTYSGFLVNSIRPKVKDIKVFSESVPVKTCEDEDFVERCWTRGESLFDLSKKIHDWGPDFVIIQHEFGIFPNAFHFMKFMEEMKDIPNIVTVHSVYQHLDKVVYTESIPNIVVHSEAGKECLKRNGNTARTFVIPHGCIQIDNTDELWNNLVSPYTVLQFGFGFSYKGVETVIKAVAHLIKNDVKFNDLYYIYLCSENSFNKPVHDEYYNSLKKLSQELGIEKNVCILRKYQTNQMLNLFLRLAKIAVFPYTTDPENIVYGASGAIRVAMANHRPVIASQSHMFDDLEGVVPRPADEFELAKTIDEIFSSSEYKENITQKCVEYVKENSWDKVADSYISLYNELTHSELLGNQTA